MLTNIKYGVDKNKVTSQNKKTLKAAVISSLITAIVIGSVGVAAVSLTAKDIPFTSTTEGWNATNVEDAMNDLYDISKDASGKKIYKLGTYTTGKTFNIASIVGIENVGKYNASNFLVVLSGSSSTSTNTTGSEKAKDAYADSSFSIPSVAYDSSSGVVTVSGGILAISIRQSYANSGSSSSVPTKTVYFIDNNEIITVN